MLAVLIENLHIFLVSMLKILFIFLVFGLEKGTPHYACAIPGFITILRFFIFLPDCC
jgi:hypothetical protein